MSLQYFSIFSILPIVGLIFLSIEASISQDVWEVGRDFIQKGDIMALEGITEVHLLTIHVFAMGMASNEVSCQVDGSLQATLNLH